MTTPTPVAGTSWWRNILNLEPVLVATFVRAVVAVLATVGILLPWDAEGWAVGAFVAVVAAVEAGLAIYARIKSTPSVNVVEKLTPSGAFVIAGPANNQVEDGRLIRHADAEPEPQTRREYREANRED